MMEAGAAATWMLVTMGGVIAAPMLILKVPFFELSWVEVALMVSEPDVGKEEGAV